VPYCFGQLSALVVTHVTRRGTDESGNRKLFLVFRHIYSYHRIFVVEQIFGQGFSQFCLTYPGTAQKDKGAYGAFGILQAGSASAYSIGYGVDCFVLTYYPAMQFFLETQQFHTFALHHFIHRNACPARNHFGYILGIDFFFDKLSILLQSFECVAFLFDGGLGLLYGAIAYFGHFAVIAFALGLFGFKTQTLDFCFKFLNAVYM